MTTLLQFPQEVLNNILTQLHDQDIHAVEQCSSECYEIVTKTIRCCLQHREFLEVSTQQISSLIRRIELVDLNNLKELSLFINRFTIEDINQFLSRCPALQAVKISCDNAPRTYLDLAALRLPETIEWLNLDTLPLTDKGFPSLKHLHKLDDLSVERTRITHAALTALPSRSLSHFSIRHNQITDGAFHYILLLSKLQCIATGGTYLSGRSVTVLMSRGIVVI